MIVRAVSVVGLIAIAFVAGCAANSSATIAPRVDRASTTQLWAAHRNPRLTPLQLAYVEVELASRGQLTLGSSYLGQRTTSHYQKSEYARPRPTETSSDLRNCSDFSSSWQAQRYFLDSGGPARDPNNLDADGDGLACEWGNKLRGYARKARRSIQRKSPRRYSSTCYTGPRGGRYTITASGRKNYNGC